MKGTIAILGKESNQRFLSEDPTRSNSTIGVFHQEYGIDDFSIKREINNRFPEDKVFTNDESVFIAVDGVILNSKELQTKYSCFTNFDLIKELFQRFGSTFIKELRGDFSLTLYELKSKTLFVYTNITSTKPIYYSKHSVSNTAFISSNPMLLIETLKKNNVSLTPNIDAFYISAAYSYLFGEDNYANEVKKLEPGHFLSIKDGNLATEKYHEFSTYPEHTETKEQIIDGIEERFSYALKLQYEKDREYNYDHLATLSGGLDSRMTVLAAHKMGYKADTITFSSRGYWDELIARDIASSYAIKNDSYEIANGDYIKNYQRIFDVDGGVVSFHIAAQMPTLYDQVDFTKYGLIHTGQVGDAIFGTTLCDTLYHIKLGPIYPKYPTEYQTKVEPKLLPELLKHDTLEITRFYNHVFNGTSKGNWLMYDYSESASPFTFQEVFEYGIQTPLKFRRHHQLYFDWLDKYHTKAGSFFYEGTKRRTVRFSNNRYINKAHHILMKFRYLQKGLKTKDNKLLNFDHWNNNTELMSVFDTLFSSSIDTIDDVGLRSSLTIQYTNGSFDQKMCALNLVLVYMKYFTTP